MFSIIMKYHESTYLKHKIHMITLALVIIGGINWGLTAFNFNLVDLLVSNLNKLVGITTHLDKVIYIIVALSAIKLAISRDNWLPFLGKTVLPENLIPLKELKGNTVVKVKVSPNTKVAYWASSKVNTNDIPTVEKAYGNYSNDGVVMSDANGVAMLVFNEGTSYKVPTGREISRHVHYRELKGEYGMIGPVQTQYY